MYAYLTLDYCLLQLEKLPSTTGVHIRCDQRLVAGRENKAIVLAASICPNPSTLIVDGFNLKDSSSILPPGISKVDESNLIAFVSDKAK